MRRGALAACAVLLGACASAQAPSEAPLVLPPFPQAGSLVEFEIGALAGFRYFVDVGSLSVAAGVVRYTLLARSPGAPDNVSYESMRCASGEYRIHALGRDGAWSEREGAWRPILGERVQRARSTLLREYFCPQGEPIRSAAEGVRALRDGGHPFAKGFGR